MALDIPTSSTDEVLQDRFNRQLAEELELVQTELARIKAIPNDGSIATIEDIVNYLRGE